MLVILSQFDKSAKERTAIFTRPDQSAGQIRDIVENSVIALFKRPTCPLCGACRNIYIFGSNVCKLSFCPGEPWMIIK